MIVRDTGDAWQVVLQPDHGLLAGDLARAWGNDRFAAPAAWRSVVRAATRHDDGWAIWERAPTLFSRDGGPVMPRNFLDVQIRLHLAFYRAQIAAVTDEDPYAGLLVSMHGRGLYNGRYGTDPRLRLTFAPDEQTAVNEFVAEQESRHPAWRAELGIDDVQMWTEYKLLQVYDRLSLHICTRDLESAPPTTIAPVPVTYDGAETQIEIHPDGPWRLRMDPYPFREQPVRFTLLRRLLPKADWHDDDAFRNDLWSLSVEPTEVVITPA